MLIGQYITGLTGVTQLSPPFPRGGQSAVFSIDVLDVPGGSVGLVVEVEHKNSDETSWTAAGNFTTISTTGKKTAAISGLKEQLRFTYTVSAGSSPQVYDTFWINVLAPAWAP